MKETLKHRRLGKFFVKKEFINDKLDKVKEVLSHMVVIEARYTNEHNRFDYVSICDLFDEVKDGEMVPWYELFFENKKLKARKMV
jgi:hypothetical protein